MASPPLFGGTASHSVDELYCNFVLFDDVACVCWACLCNVGAKVRLSAYPIGRRELVSVCIGAPVYHHKAVPRGT